MAAHAVQDVLRTMYSEQDVAALAPKLLQHAAGDAGVATSLIALKHVAAPAILRDSERVGWRGPKAGLRMWTAGARVAAPMLEKLATELPRSEDRRFALTLAGKAFASQHPASMDGVAGMVRGLPAARARAERDPDVHALLASLYVAAPRLPGPPSTAGWLTVSAIEFVAAWPGERVPREVLEIPRVLRTPKDAGEAGRLEYALRQLLAKLDPNGGRITSMEAGWTTWQAHLSVLEEFERVRSEKKAKL